LRTEFYVEYFDLRKGKYRFIKCGRMRWAGLVKRLREMRNIYKILVEDRKRKDHLGYLDIDERMASTDLRIIEGGLD
jgi:hypothetical protein